jgi:hypothetical protein
MKLSPKVRRWGVIPVVLAATVLFAAEDCDGGEEAPGVESDSSQSYEDGSKIPVDKEIYTITGTVVGEVTDLTRQVEPGKGSIDTPVCYGTSGCYGGGGGTFTGPVEAGKGFVRLAVEEVSPVTELAQVGRVSILKTTDSKVKALLVGDRVTFKCRRQYEAIAAVADNQDFDADEVETWELDYCRLDTAVITPGEPEIEEEPLS